jgi:hypothetical protein
VAKDVVNGVEGLKSRVLPVAEGVVEKAKGVVPVTLK